jgi:hypothetical protein
MPTFPSLDLTSFDLSKIDLSKIDLSKIDLARFDAIDLPEVDAERVKGLARDAAYVGIGLGVLAVQQAMVRRREVQATVERQLRTMVDAVR